MQPQQALHSASWLPLTPCTTLHTSALPAHRHARLPRDHVSALYPSVAQVQPGASADCATLHVFLAPVAASQAPPLASATLLLPSSAAFQAVAQHQEDLCDSMLRSVSAVRHGQAVPLLLPGSTFLGHILCDASAQQGLHRLVHDTQLHVQCAEGPDDAQGPQDPPLTAPPRPPQVSVLAEIGGNAVRAALPLPEAAGAGAAPFALVRLSGGITATLPVTWIEGDPAATTPALPLGLLLRFQTAGNASQESTPALHIEEVTPIPSVTMPRGTCVGVRQVLWEGDSGALQPAALAAAAKRTLQGLPPHHSTCAAVSQLLLPVKVEAGTPRIVFLQLSVQSAPPSGLPGGSGVMVGPPLPLRHTAPGTSLALSLATADPPLHPLQWVPALSTALAAADTGCGPAILHITRASTCPAATAESVAHSCALLGALALAGCQGCRGGDLLLPRSASPPPTLDARSLLETPPPNAAPVVLLRHADVLCPDQEHVDPSHTDARGAASAALAEGQAWFATHRALAGVALVVAVHDTPTPHAPQQPPAWGVGHGVPGVHLPGPTPPPAGTHVAAAANAAESVDEGDPHAALDAAFPGIGGLWPAKRALRDALLLPLRWPRVFGAAGMPPPRGVLLHGPSGCGKSALAAAAAEAAGVTVHSVACPSLLDKYVGGSEAALRRVWAEAQATAPAVLVLDELDAIAPQRGAGGADAGTGVTERMVNQLLTLLDGVEGGPATGERDVKRSMAAQPWQAWLAGVLGIDPKGEATGEAERETAPFDVFVIGVTSRPGLVDAALKRHGRLGTLVECGMPSAAERRSIAQALLSQHAPDEQWDASAVHALLSWAGEGARHVTGADIAGVITAASLSAAEEGAAVPSEAHVRGAFQTVQRPAQPAQPTVRGGKGRSRVALM